MHLYAKQGPMRTRIYDRMKLLPGAAEDKSSRPPHRAKTVPSRAHAQGNATGDLLLGCGWVYFPLIRFPILVLEDAFRRSSHLVQLVTQTRLELDEKTKVESKETRSRCVVFVSSRTPVSTVIFLGQSAILCVKTLFVLICRLVPYYSTVWIYCFGCHCQLCKYPNFRVH